MLGRFCCLILIHYHFMEWFLIIYVIFKKMFHISHTSSLVLSQFLLKKKKTSRNEFCAGKKPHSFNLLFDLKKNKAVFVIKRIVMSKIYMNFNVLMHFFDFLILFIIEYSTCKYFISFLSIYKQKLFHVSISSRVPHQNVILLIAKLVIIISEKLVCCSGKNICLRLFLTIL